MLPHRPVPVNSICHCLCNLIFHVLLYFVLISFSVINVCQLIYLLYSTAWIHLTSRLPVICIVLHFSQFKAPKNCLCIVKSFLEVSDDFELKFRTQKLCWCQVLQLAKYLYKTISVQSSRLWSTDVWGTRVGYMVRIMTAEMNNKNL